MKNKVGFMAGLFCCLISTSLWAAQTTVDFVQILNGNNKEAEYYYQQNWQALRQKAQQRGYIQSWQLLATAPDSEAPFDFMLITTYGTDQQYLQRESHFQQLIKEAGELKLLNRKKPQEFRKTLFGIDAKSWQ